ncbi:MAG: KEOPS complex subunit Pcc1 [Candidatus Helarchaeota archaeon]
MNLVNEIKLKMNIEFKNKKFAEIIYNSILPELKYSPNDRSILTAELFDNKIILKIDSADFVNLRAVINSYLRWFNISLKIIEISLI